MPQSLHHKLLWTFRDFVLQLKRDLVKLPPRHLYVFHSGRPGRMLYLDTAIDECEQSYFLPQVLELASHLKCHHASAGEAGKVDGTILLLPQDLPNVVRGESLQAARLRSID